MPSQHKHQPIPFRPTARNRPWLLEQAAETKRPVNAILNDAVTAHRKALREQRQRERGKAMPKQETEETIRAKWLMDDATTLAEAAAKLRAEADRLERMHKEGWTLTAPVEDDWGFAVPPKSS